MSNPLKIGTRNSPLALTQANLVQKQLERLGAASQLVFIQSCGDLNLVAPLHRMGETGIFTKALDKALYTGAIDLAVHSLKDLPTEIAPELILAAVLPRGAVGDVLILRPDIKEPAAEALIATGSLRRRSQWLARHPDHTMVNLRGNVASRLQKLEQNGWTGAVFAKAGLMRLQLLPPHYLDLDWMLPAPAQGAIAVVSRADDQHLKHLLSGLNDKNTALAVTEERKFLQCLEGGCSAPIGALLRITGGRYNFRGGLFSLDGKQKALVTAEGDITELTGVGVKAAAEILNNGGTAIMRDLRKVMPHA